MVLPTVSSPLRTLSSFEAGGWPPPQPLLHQRRSPRRKIPPRIPPPRRSRTSPRTPRPYSKIRYFSLISKLQGIFTWARPPWFISAEMLIVLNYNEENWVSSSCSNIPLQTTPLISQILHCSQEKGKIPFLGGGWRLGHQVSRRNGAHVHASLTKGKTRVKTNS